MKRIVFTAENTGFKHLQRLQNELKNVGIAGFDVDFISREISVTCPNSQNIDTLECAVRKAGYRCNCFMVYQSTD